MRFLPGLLLLVFSPCSFADAISDKDSRLIEARAEQAVMALVEPHAHAMRSGDQSVEQARTMINLYFRYTLADAVKLKKDGQEEKALFQFYMARHILRDAALPSMNAANGDPAVAGTPIVHDDIKSREWRNKIDADVRKMFDEMKIPRGDLLERYGVDSDVPERK